MVSKGAIFFRVKTVLVLVLFLNFQNNAFSQTSGEIHDPAIPATNPMDPNGDGWVTSSGTTFTVGDELSQFEIDFIELPPIDSEPSSDLDTGASCGSTEIIGDADTNSVGAYYAIVDQDGIPDNGDEVIIFRLRVAKDGTGAFGYSFLFDTDNLIGSDDPNSVSGNPGFEMEVYFDTKDVNVQNVDGSTSGTIVSTYSGTSNSQKSEALNGDCTKNDPIFLDFYVPLADLGLTTTSNFRVAAASSSSPSSALGGSASDIAGTNDDLYPSDDANFIAIINAFDGESDLSLSKTVSSTIVSINDTVTYTLTVTNNGPRNNKNIIVKDIIPLGFTYNHPNYSTSIGEVTFNSATNELIWDLGSNIIDVDSFVTLSYTVTVTSCGTFTNFAEITSAFKTDPDSTPNNGQ